MYPTSSENPGPRASALRRASPLSDSTVGAESRSNFHPYYRPDSRQKPARSTAGKLLVVEARRGDRWRVVLCTGLEDLDDALDTVRQLKKSDDIDEVCLAIEVSGAQGRESRREVLRFHKVPDQMAGTVSRPVAGTATAPSDEPAAADEASLFRSAWDDTIAAMMPPASEPASPKAPFEDRPQGDPAPEHAQEHDPQSGQTDKTHIGDSHADAESQQPPPRPGTLYDPDELSSFRHAQQSFASHRHGWIDDLLNQRNSAMDAAGPRHDTLYDRGDEEEDEDEDEDPDQPDAPVFARRNDTTAKILVFAGSIALLFLGGALVELLAMDVTSAARAGSFFLN